MKGTGTALIGLTSLILGQGDCLAASICRFEGPRNAAANISEDPTTFSIEASLIPVTTFDPATNDQLNRAKLRGVALMGLTRHLNIPPASDLSVAELRDTGLRGDPARAIMQFEVSKSGVRVTERPIAVLSKPPSFAPPAAGAIRAPGGSLLLTRKGDYLDTLAQLQQVNLVEITDLATPDTPVEYLTDAEQAITGQYQSLRHSVDADLLLLTVERDEVHGAIAEAQQELSGQLAEARKVMKSPSPATTATREPAK